MAHDTRQSRDVLELLREDHEEFRARWVDLQEAVLRHLDNEEREEFPLLNAHLDPVRRKQLGTTFHMLREAGPTSPYPKTRTSPDVA